MAEIETVLFIINLIFLVLISGDKFKIKELKKNLMDSRYATYLFVSIWKIAVFLAAMVVILWIQGENVDNIFNLFSESFASHPITIEEVRMIRFLWGLNQ